LMEQQIFFEQLKKIQAMTKIFSSDGWNVFPNGNQNPFLGSDKQISIIWFDNQIFSIANWFGDWKLKTKNFWLPNFATEKLGDQNYSHLI
jgi:hypothetical protein